MQACCDVAFDYAHQRKQFNTKIGEFQVCGRTIVSVFDLFEIFMFVTTRLQHSELDIRWYSISKSLLEFFHSSPASYKPGFRCGDASSLVSRLESGFQSRSLDMTGTHF
jgi:hypothetical protein